MVRRVGDCNLREAIEILTAMETKRRMEIYLLLKNVRIDEGRLPMFH